MDSSSSQNFKATKPDSPIIRNSSNSPNIKEEVKEPDQNIKASKTISQNDQTKVIITRPLKSCNSAFNSIPCRKGPVLKPSEMFGSQEYQNLIAKCERYMEEEIEGVSDYVYSIIDSYKQSTASNLSEDPTFRFHLKALQLEQTGLMMPSLASDVSPFTHKSLNEIKQEETLK